MGTLSQGLWSVRECDTPQRPGGDLIPSAQHASKRSDPIDSRDIVYGLKESEVKVMNHYSTIAVFEHLPVQAGIRIFSLVSYISVPTSYR